MREVFADNEALSRAAAQLFAVRAREAVAAQGRCAVLLSGGGTPRRTYELLGQEPHRSGIPWGQVHFFWGDERCVPADDPRRNALMAQRALLDALPVPPEQIHPLECDRAPDLAAEGYAAELRDFFKGGPPRFDFIFLGLGEDGHTASLLPGSAALEEKVRWTAVTRRAEEPFSRVTLTAPLLNQAAVAVFLVTGRSKAAVVRSLLEETDQQPLFPAALIRPSAGTLYWFLDREAACLLKGQGRPQ